MRFLIFKNMHNARLRLYFAMDGYFLGTIGKDGDRYAVYKYIPGALIPNAFESEGDFATLEEAIDCMKRLEQTRESA